MRQKRICFGLGSAAVDFRVQTADMGAAYTGKLLSQHVEMLPGGAIANCLAQISRLGGSTCWLGKLGKDWLGARIAEQLAADHIDTGAVIFDAACCSPFNVAAYAGEERRRVGGWLLPNSLAALTADEIAAWGPLAAEHDWLAVELGEIPLEIVQQACEVFAARGVKIAIDVDLDPVAQCRSDRKTIECLFRSADILIPNRHAMKTLYGDLSACELSKAMYRDTAVPVVVTDGGEGAWACNESGTICQPAVPVRVIDTVGAGDAFHGGLIWSLSEGHSLDQAMELASQCGAEACRIKGARPVKEEGL